MDVPLERVTLPLAGGAVEVWRAAALERFVDRDALLGAAAPPEPPYWMHLWPGALALARRLASAGRLDGTTVLELGCGLGVPAVVAARAGARVVASDWQRPPLTIAARSAAANGVGLAGVQMDWRAPALRGQFDLCLGADIAYDADAEAGLVAAVAALTRPGGAVWLADSVNTMRTTLLDRLAATGFATTVESVREEEDGRPVWVRLIIAERR